MTIEDPVENVIDGVNQSQIFPDIGYTFAGALRTALRQDPDIINIAIEAALTGHLVLSTIHTNSAAETLTRILNMGIQPFLLPAAINAIIAQRLVRRLCKNCRKPVKADTLPKNMQTSLRRAIARIDKQELIDRISPEILARSEFYEAV